MRNHLHAFRDDDGEGDIGESGEEGNGQATHEGPAPSKVYRKDRLLMRASQMIDQEAAIPV